MQKYKDLAVFSDQFFLNQTVVAIIFYKNSAKKEASEAICVSLRFEKLDDVSATKGMKFYYLLWVKNLKNLFKLGRPRVKTMFKVWSLVTRIDLTWK